MLHTHKFIVDWANSKADARNMLATAKKLIDGRPVEREELANAVAADIVGTVQEVMRGDKAIYFISHAIAKDEMSAFLKDLADFDYSQLLKLAPRVKLTPVKFDADANADLIGSLAAFVKAGGSVTANNGVMSFGQTGVTGKVHMSVTGTRIAEGLKGKEATGAVADARKLGKAQFFARIAERGGKLSAAQKQLVKDFIGKGIELNPNISRALS